MNLVEMNKIKIIDCDTFINVFKYYKVYNKKQKSISSLSKKPLIRVLTHELIQAFEIPVSEYYNILREFSELAMINNIQLCSRKRFKVLKSTCTIDNYTS